MRLHVIKSGFILLVIAAIVTCISSCKKDNSSPAPVPVPIVPAPVIFSISPNHGPANTTVIITGTNFSSNVNDNIVKLNGKTVIVTSATTTQLTVTVPVGAGTGNILVKVTAVRKFRGLYLLMNLQGLLPHWQEILADQFLNIQQG